MRSDRRGVSNVIAALMGIAIFFSTIVPLMFVFRTSSAAVEGAYFERRKADQERIVEHFDVAAYQDFLVTAGTASEGSIFLYVRNRSDLTIEVLGIWLTKKGATTLELGTNIINYEAKNPVGAGIAEQKASPAWRDGKDNVFLPREEAAIFDTGFVAIIGEAWHIQVLTRRGSVIIPIGSPITGGTLETVGGGGAGVAATGVGSPFALAVTIVNMQPGLRHIVTLTGNLPGGIKKLSAKPTAGNNYATLGFGVNPGDFQVKLEREENDLTLTTLRTATLTVPDTLQIFLDASTGTKTASLDYSWVLPLTGKGTVSLTAVSNQAYQLLINIKNTGGTGVKNIKATIEIVSNSSPAWSVSTSTTVDVGTLFPAEAGFAGWTLKASSGNNKSIRLQVKITADPVTVGDPDPSDVSTSQITITTT